VGYLLRLVAKLKIKLTEQWIKDFFESNPDKKLVCLTMHTSVIDHLKEAFPKAVIIDGRVTGRLREETKRQFQTNKRVNLLLGNWRAAGVGITLTAAHHLAALDFPFTPGDLMQGEDRIHRIGQSLDVIIYYLAVLGTIEEKLIKILRDKTKVIDAILNGEASGEDIDIFGELLKMFSKQKDLS
jgi:SWI/SNF-related matrix-associated actin-dependent regulator 1 of chromatin subfamily A